MIKLIYNVSLWLVLLVPLSASAQTAFTENFNDGTAGWNGGSYTLTPENGNVKVTGRKTFQWDGFLKTFGPIDITTSPYVNIKIKSKIDFQILVGLGSGDIAAGKLVYPDKPLPPNSKVGFPNYEVVPSDEFQEYSFNFSNKIGGDVDFTKITWINVLINPLAPFDNTAAGQEFYIDDIEIGTTANITPSISNVLNQAFTVKETGSVAKMVNLRNITDGGDLTNAVTISATSSNTTLIPNSNIAVNYTSPSRQGTLSITPTNNVIGESVITVKVSAPNTADKLMTFKVEVKPNAAPVMDAIANMSLKKGVTTKIPLTKVFDGNPESIQQLTVSSTSSNTAVIPNPTVTFDQATGAGYLSIMPLASAANGSTSTISVVLTDDGGTAQGGVNTKTYTFDAIVFAEVNKPPFFDLVANQTTQNTLDVHIVTLTGATNGDNGVKDITFSAVSSNTNVVNNISFGPVSNGASVMSYSTVGEGTATITVTLQDAQGNADNNGNLSYVRTFTITSIPASNTSFVENFNGSTVPNGVYPPNQHVLSMDNGALKVVADFPAQTYPGTIIDLPTISGRTIDISQNPFIKVRLKSSSTNNNGVIKTDPASKQTLFRISLWDQDNDAAYQNATVELSFPADDQWHEFLLDYRGKFFNDETVADGKKKGQVDSTKIKQLLVNFDTRWWTPVKGEYWIDFIQMGEGLSVESVGAVKGPGISNQTIFKGESAKPLVLKGINDGKGGDKVSFTITSSKPSLVSDVAISNVVGGTATLSYTFTTPSVKLDSAKIRVISFNPENPSFKRDTVDFYVFAIDTTGSVPATITINKTQTFQTMHGMGTALPTDPQPEIVKVAKDMNFTVYRVFGDFDRIEEVNDNGDPNVLALENFNFNMKTMSDIRALHAATNAKFFYTILTAPFWLKYNKAKHAFLGTEGYATNNRYKADMYDEYAEFCVAIVRGFKAFAGVDLYGLSLQNEPEVGVPYESTQVSPEEYVEMIKVVGRRFKAEGISTTIMMPEDVTGFPDWYLGQMAALEKDEEARSYVGMGAIHIYDRAGVNPASGASLVWDQFVQATKRAVPSGELWMTEVSGYSNTWEGEHYYIYAKKEFAPGPLVYAATLYRGFRFGQVNAWIDLDRYVNHQGSHLYGVYKSYTKYMVPGTKMVGAASSDNNILSLAFTHPDGTLTTILLNTTNIPLKVKITGGEGAYQMNTTMKHASFKDMGVVASGMVMLPANSISVLHSTSGNINPTIDAVANMNVGVNGGAKTVNLTGISDGEVVKSQALTVTATSADPTVATVSVQYNSPSAEGNLVVTPLKVGTTKVRVLVKDNGGVANNGVDSTFIEFTVNVTSVNGVANAEHGSIHVFPNPANSQINISVSSENITEISISDLSGRVLLQRALVSRDEAVEVDISGLNKGMYIIAAKGSKTVLINKFYKQ